IRVSCLTGKRISDVGAIKARLGQSRLGASIDILGQVLHEDLLGSTAVEKTRYCLNHGLARCILTSREAVVMGEHLSRNHAAKEPPGVPLPFDLAESRTISLRITPAQVRPLGEFLITGARADQKELLCRQAGAAIDGQVIGKEERK